ncbi:MAG: hypothetical protein HRU22_15620 [Gammaproteobacteria bacterium]|nr:hypothetical protein [Gammaproteobacteria bacterium]
MSSIDTSNINHFYQGNHSWLFQLFSRKLSNHADAADLAHDAFIRLMTRPKLFDNNSGARLRALGTRFNVRQFSDNQVQLSVFEDRVAVYQTTDQASQPAPYIVAALRSVPIFKHSKLSQII